MPRIALTGIAIASALTFALPTGASAQNPACANAGPFCIDGTITDANNSGLAGAAKSVDPNGSAKEPGPINGSSTKIGVINTAPTPMLGLTNPNAQVDLNAIYTQTAVDANSGHVWYYFAWARDSSSGSGFISIELQKSGVPLACSGPDGYSASSCNPWSGRQTGDFILLWDQQGNATQISIRFYNATLHAFGPKIDLDASTSRATYSGDFFRGEAAIDFTAVVFPQNGECQSFANTIPGTVTGNSDTADYKDTVLSAFPPVSNCGSVTIKKVTVPSGQSGSFGYTLAHLPAGDIFDGTIDSDCSDPTDKTQCQATLTGDQDMDTITDLLASPVGVDNYTLSESSIPSNFTLASISCTLGNTTYNVYPGNVTFRVEATKTTACTITNNLNTGSLRVRKVVNAGFGLTASRSNFSYQVALNGGNAGSLTPFLDNDTGQTYTLPKDTTFIVTEPSTLPGWSAPTYSGCTGTIAVGQESVCTVTNTAQPAQPAILTTQQAVLHDQANIAGVRRGTGETALTVNFYLYPSQAACNADTNKNGTGSIGSNTNRPVTFANSSATSGSAATNTGVTVSNSGTYYWRVVSTGNNLNSGFSSDCSESVVVTFAGS